MISRPWRASLKVGRTLQIGPAIGLLVSLGLVRAVRAAPAAPARTEPASCQTVRPADVGWSDVTATTATLNQVLRDLGYTPRTTLLSVPVTFASIRSGAKYTLAVPAYTYDRGLHEFADIARFADALHSTMVLFGLGVVPALISTIVFALPAPVRLTHSGISSVPPP